MQGFQLLVYKEDALSEGSAGRSALSHECKDNKTDDYSKCMHCHLQAFYMYIVLGNSSLHRALSVGSCAREIGLSSVRFLVAATDLLPRPNIVVDFHNGPFLQSVLLRPASSHKNHGAFWCHGGGSTTRSAGDPSGTRY